MRGSRAISIRQGPPREARPGPRDSADATTGPAPAVVWSRPRSGYAPRADRVVPRRGDRRHRSRPGVRCAAPLRSGCGRGRQGGADRGGARAGSRRGDGGRALPPARTGLEAPADLCAPSTTDRGRRTDGPAVEQGFAQMPAARPPGRDPASRPVRDLARDDERPVPSAGRPPHRIASGPHPRSPGGTSREPRMPDGESGDPADRSVTITPARCAWGADGVRSPVEPVPPMPAAAMRRHGIGRRRDRPRSVPDGPAAPPRPARCRTHAERPSTWRCPPAPSRPPGPPHGSPVGHRPRPPGRERTLRAPRARSERHGWCSRPRRRSPR